MGVWTILLALAAVTAPAPVLYLIENLCTRGDGVVDTRALVRLGFGPDGRVVKETIVSRDQRFFGHFGGHRLFGDRYLATAFGGVVDLVDKRVIHDEQDGKLLGVEGDRVVFAMQNTRREPGIFAFDCATRTLRKLAELGHGALPGKNSPDRTLSVENDGLRAGTITLHRLDGTTKVLTTSFQSEQSEFSSNHGNVPLLWLDTRRILTQRRNGQLVILDIDGRSEPLLEIRDIPPQIGSPSLYREPGGRIIYSVASRGDSKFAIDVVARTATPLGWDDLGHGFEESVAVNEHQRHEIRHGGTSLGRWRAHTYERRTGPGVIAFPFVEDGVSPAADGVAVWSADRGWQTIKMWPNDLIGWAE